MQQSVAKLGGGFVDSRKNKIITVQDIPITISVSDMDDYICITDIAAAKDGNSRAADVVKNWIRNRMTLEFLGTWEQIYNPDFKVVEFDHFKSEAGLHTFVLSVSEWIESTNAKGIYVKKGRYGGTYAHKDIAFEFASAISPVFKLYLIKEFQRLKEEENNQKRIEWNAQRFLTKNNYLIQTDAVKNYIIPKGDYVKNIEWLAYNAQMIREGKSKIERFEILKEIAKYQLDILESAERLRLENKATNN